MSYDKSKLKTKAVGAATLVALSGFVPQPLVNLAQAATATISVTGSFITGIKLAAGTTAKFGSNAASGINGKMVLSTAGAVTPSKGVHIGGGKQAGSFQFTAVSTVPNIDITVKGLGKLTLSKSAGGLGPVGTAKLQSVTFGKIGAATTLTDGGAGTAKKANYNITKKTTKMLVGATVVWGATIPIGSFATPITVTMAF